METMTLAIYDERIKHEIVEFLKKFSPQEAEIKFDVCQQNLEIEAMEIKAQIEKHPFFGMITDNHESVEETINRLRGVRS